MQIDKREVGEIQQALMRFRDAVSETGYPLAEIWQSASWEAAEATLNVYTTNNTSEPHYPFEIEFADKLEEIVTWCDAVIEECEEILAEG